jgi:XTP/dITP diphosphohydrolase
MQTLILATNNVHKVEEINHFVGDKFDLITLQQVGFEGDIHETGSTLAENSLIKAQYIWDTYHKNCMADDSGLEVFSLNNEPGVISARYAGEQRSHEDNMNLLLYNLKEKSDRSAQFRTVITLIIDGKINQFEGIIRGEIIHEKRGSQGFGYDPIFLPEGYVHTFAEMNLEEKTGLSHRTRAIEKMVDYLAINTLL